MYGRKFKDEKLNRLFYGPKGWVAGSWPYAPFEPNSNYGQHLLSKTDWQMLKLIDLIEQRSGQIPEATPIPFNANRHFRCKHTGVFSSDSSSGYSFEDSDAYFARIEGFFRSCKELKTR